MPHIHDKIDFTVEVFIVHEGKVLLRKHDKYKIWLSVGGHIELDEDPNEAALREVKEEVGLDITLHGHARQLDIDRSEYKELIPPVFLNRHKINDTHEHVTHVYFASTAKAEITESIEAEQSEECRWFSLEELEKLPDLWPSVKYYAQTALKTLS